MRIVTIVLAGQRFSLDDATRTWSGGERATRDYLGSLLPPDSPAEPHWPQLVADTMADMTGAEIAFVVDPEHVAGRVY